VWVDISVRSAQFYDKIRMEDKVMALMLDEEMDENVTTIKVIGVGGGGGNAVNRMVSDGLQGVEFIAMNTDQQALAKNHATVKVQLGSKLTKGRGAGADPEIGQRAAEESKDEIANALKGSQMVFITAGMGGGTGTGAAPVVAEVAHDLGILTVGIVTKPFSFEGKRKMGLAEQGIANLLMHVDSLIVIPNERLKMISQEKITLMNAFQAADNVLRQGVESISALINVPAFINLDFADVRSIMKDAGYAHMGVGSAKGAGKAENAAKAAISSPLLETSIAGAHGVIINITSSPDIGLEDVETAAGLITQSAHPDANIIWGTAFDENLSDEMRVTVVATGFDNKSASDLRNSINNAMGGAQSVPSAVFSSDTGSAATAAAPAAPAAAPAAPAAAAKPVEEESSDNRYYNELLAILNKRK
jgi:cell division protein FtsZ